MAPFVPAKQVLKEEAGTDRLRRPGGRKSFLEPRVGITLENAGARKRVSGTPKLLAPQLPYSAARGIGLPPNCDSGMAVRNSIARVRRARTDSKPAFLTILSSSR